MRKWCLLLAMLMFLSGCAAQTNSDKHTDPSQAEPTEPSGTVLYDGDHKIETQTDGAVKAYLLGKRECLGMAPMGEDWLLFGKDRMILLKGQELEEVLTVDVPNIPLPGSGMVQIQPQGVAYYDSESHTIVFLGSNLNETGCLQLSEKPVGDVYLTPDWSGLYYCTLEGIRVLDVSTGVCRTLKAQNGQWQGISGGFLDGGILRAQLRQEDGTLRTLLVSGKTGETVAQGVYLNELIGTNDLYFLPKVSGSLSEWIFGWEGAKPQNIWPASGGRVTALLEDSAIVTVSQEDGGIFLDYYNLITGRREGAVTLPELSDITVLYARNGKVWFCCEGTLYRWDTEMSKTGDKTRYTANRGNLNDPSQGEPAFVQRLQVLEQRYGVQFWYGAGVFDCSSPEYSFESEYLIRAYEGDLETLEAFFARFPENFFGKATQWTGSGKLQILLLRSIRCASGEADAIVRYFQGGEAYLALALGEWTEQDLFRETAYLMDMKVLSSCKAFDSWENLNPSKFTYGDHNTDENHPYLQDAKRYFIDTYAMTSPVEDRVRILEYASLPGNDHFFASKTMQKKLQTICEGIRKAFDLEGGSFLWEQYLKE